MANSKLGLVLRVVFSEYISRFDEDKIEIYQDERKLNANTIETMYQSAVGQLIIVLKKANSTLGRYQVKLKANAVFNVTDNGNDKLLETETDTLDFSKKVINGGNENSYVIYRNSTQVMPNSIDLHKGNVVITLKDTVNSNDLFYVIIAGAITATDGGRNANISFRTGVVSQTPDVDTKPHRIKKIYLCYLQYHEPDSVSEI